MAAMSSNRSYLIRAMYEWILDNDCTPYLLVDAATPNTEVPQQFVKDGQIVLNLAPSAVVSLVMDRAAIQCSARFGGVPMSLYVPTGAVLGIYAKENGQGMIFDGPEPTPEPPPPESPPAGKSGSRPSLKVVKSGLKVVK